MNDEQFAHFLACIEQGTSPALAEMFALGQPPASRTDREFLAGFGPSGGQFAKRPEQGDFYAQEAKRQGVDITGAVYLSGLAAYPGDPRAWVRGRGDAKKVCEERGWGCEGDVHVPLTKVEQPTGGGLAEDILQAEMAKKLEEVPEADRPGVKLEDLREQVITEKAPHWAQKDTNG
jgi:hypothetical protein